MQKFIEALMGKLHAGCACEAVQTNRGREKKVR
jgi:hypothetical protein